MGLRLVKPARDVRLVALEREEAAAAGRHALARWNRAPTDPIVRVHEIIVSSVDGLNPREVEALAALLLRELGWDPIE